MPEEILEEKELSVEDYLKLFEAGSADYEMVKKEAEKLEKIRITLVKDSKGRRAEDTTFFEKNGMKYTIRSIL